MKELFDLAKRMADALRETRDGCIDLGKALDPCCEFDAIDARHDQDEWKRIHEPDPAEQGEGLSILSECLAWLEYDSTYVESQSKAPLDSLGLRAESMAKLRRFIASRPQPEAKVVPMAMLQDASSYGFSSSKYDEDTDNPEQMREIAARYGYMVKE